MTDTKRDEAATTAVTIQPRNLDDFPSYVQAAANLTELRRREADLAARLIEADSGMRERARDKSIPPAGNDREVNELRQQIEMVKAGIVAADRAVRSAAAEASIAISKSAKPAHDKLRMRVIAALTELRDALKQEQMFRAGMDARGVLTAAVITPATFPELNQPGKLDALIANLKGGF